MFCKAMERKKHLLYVSLSLIAQGAIVVDLSQALWLVLVGGATLALEALGRALWVDVAKRASVSVWGIRIFDYLTGWALHDPLWSGEWKVTWQVGSKNFLPVNEDTGQLYRCFNSFAIEGSGTTSSGRKIPYAFVGKLSRDKSIATGLWFDNRGGNFGYHGVFQMRVQSDGTGVEGLWTGFSEATSAIKSGKMSWQRSSD